MSDRVIEGLRLVLSEREGRISSALHVSDDVRKVDVYVWRKGHDLATHAEQHALGILAAVEEFRRADLELTETLKPSVVSGTLDANV